MNLSVWQKKQIQQCLIWQTLFFTMSNKWYIIVYLKQLVHNILHSDHILQLQVKLLRDVESVCAYCQQFHPGDIYLTVEWWGDTF